MTPIYDSGLSHEEYRKTGQAGNYRSDLDRYFIAGMNPPPAAPMANNAPMDSLDIAITKQPKSGKANV